MAASVIEYTPVINFKLRGALRQFGKSYPLAVRTPAEAVKALCVQIPGFERYLSNAKSRGLEFAVFRDKRNIGEGELNFSGSGDITIAPVITGSKRGGSLQTIIGSVLIAAAFVLSFTPFAAASPFLYQVGAAMAIGGIIQMLSPRPAASRPAPHPRTPPATPLAAPRTPRHLATLYRFATASDG